jgi:hypothetical protein
VSVDPQIVSSSFSSFFIPGKGDWQLQARPQRGRRAGSCARPQRHRERGRGRLGRGRRGILQRLREPSQTIHGAAFGSIFAADPPFVLQGVDQME